MTRGCVAPGLDEVGVGGDALGLLPATQARRSPHRTAPLKGVRRQARNTYLDSGFSFHRCPCSRSVGQPCRVAPGRSAGSPRGCCERLRSGHTSCESQGVTARRPCRAPSFSYCGRYRYFVTTCTDGRRRVFRNRLLVRRVLMHLRQAARYRKFSITAYCFMPDHLHFLAEGLDDDSDFRRLIHDFKHRSGFEYRKATRNSLWQVGYYDHVLRRDEAAKRITALHHSESCQGRSGHGRETISVLGIR